MPKTDFDSLWNYGQPAETEMKFRALVSATLEDPDYRLQLQTQIARTLSLQRKFAEAHATLDEVEKSLNSVTTTAEIRYLLERGRTYNSAKQAGAALPLFLRAWEFALARKQDGLAVDAAHMVAIAEPNPEQKMEWNLKAVALAEKSDDPKAQKWLGSLYNNIGWTYHGSEKFTEALNLFRRALAFRQTHGDAESVRVAHWCVGRALRSLGQNDEALKIQNALKPDGYVNEELGELYLVFGNSELAKKHFSLAFQSLSQDVGFKANEPARLQRMKDLGGE